MLDREAWYNRPFTSRKKEFLSGTLFLRNNLMSKLIVDKWISNCNEKVWEQQVLEEILKESGIAIYELPISYCYMKTLPNGSLPHVKCAEPVIVHNQASRKLKGLIR